MIVRDILMGAASTWWIHALRGVLAILFGIYAFLWPGLTLGILVIVWGAFALVDGVMAVFTGVRGRWWSMVLFGALAVAAGIVTLLWPGITAVALLVMIAVWAIVRGVLEVIAAISLRRVLTNEWVLVVSGILAILFGVGMLAFPAAGALAVVWLIGLYALVTGVLLLVLAFRLRNLTRHRDAPLPA